ncbi:M15 family metallopeptidase [Ruminococcus sp.]|uniref:M15 family metallopeptidase n=1 Tax=Ruminococcus sp. TaxID=41978 RepID=UPI0025F39437|nr:M15 family metallopeptidase [Ruminococcus sp.]
MKETKRCKLKTERVFLAMGIIVGTLFGADGVRRSFESRRPYNLKVQGDFRDAGEHDEAPAGSSLSFTPSAQTTTVFEGVENVGLSEYELSKEDVSKGVLSIYTDSKAAKESDQEKMTDLSKAKNDFYTLCDEKVYLNEDAADALNSMMEDYANETALTDFIVYGTTETYTGDGSYCPKAFAESKAGYCVDLALNAGGYVLPYDGYDAEGWVVENCWKYGFIVRYPEGKREKTGNEYCPWHLRYVGDIHAAIMKQKSMCLEEYVDFLEQYTLEEPYSFSFNGIAYQIYSVTGSEDKLTTRVPVAGNYELSGDNKNSFIITALKN